MSSLTKTVTQLQDSRDNYHEEKRRKVTVKQQENERKERDWKCEITQLNQVTPLETSTTKFRKFAAFEFLIAIVLNFFVHCDSRFP